MYVGTCARVYVLRPEDFGELAPPLWIPVIELRPARLYGRHSFFLGDPPYQALLAFLRQVFTLLLRLVILLPSLKYWI